MNRKKVSGFISGSCSMKLMYLVTEKLDALVDSGG